MLAESGGDLVLPARVLCASTERSDKYQGKGRAGEDPVITAATHGASPKVRMSFTRALAACQRNRGTPRAKEISDPAQCKQRNGADPNDRHREPMS